MNNIKLTHSKGDKSLNTDQKKGRLQIKKKVYNKTFETFIEDKYGEGVHFGSMNSNLEEIIKYLSLDDLMEGVVKLPRIDVNTLSVVNDGVNEFSDFNAYDNFECTFLAKDGVGSDDFMKGIEKLQSDLLDTYNKKIHKEILERDQENRQQIKKREIREIVFFTVLAIITMIIIYFFFNK
ncbi:MAG: hypothetical protein AAF611_14945 [Bacteroidota bacterium]